MSVYLAVELMAIYTHEDGSCSISSHGVWMPGCYENERTARFAFRFSDEVLRNLMDEANARNGGPGGTITFADLTSAKARMIDRFSLAPLE